MQVALFLFLNSIVIISSYLFNSRLFNASGRIDFFISWFLLYFSQVISSELALGLLGGLSLRNLILLNLAVLLFSLLVRPKITYSLSIKGERVTGLLSDKVILLAVSAITVFGLSKLLINLFNPPFGWDDLNYHFTFAVEWLKNANLNNPATVFDDPAPTYYPLNGSLFFLWLIFPFKNVFLADLGQFPFFILAFLAVYSIAVKARLGRREAFLCACLFSLIPNYFKQAQIAYVDIMVAAWFLVSLNCILYLKKDFSLGWVSLYGISLGLLAGTKNTGLLYAALLFIPCIFLCPKNKRGAAGFILVVSLAVIFGGFSYIRNLLETGNPLYPMDISVMGNTLFKGVIDSRTYSAHFSTEDYNLAKILFHEGLGAQSLVFILPWVFLALPLALIKKRKELDFSFIYFLLLPLFLYLLWRYIVPLANTRYLYPLLGTGVVIGFYSICLLNIPRIVVNIFAVICILASISELAKRQELAFGIVLTILFFFAAPDLLKRVKIRPAGAALFLIASLILLAVAQKFYVKNEYSRYVKMVKYSGFWPDAVRAWEWLNESTSGDNIAYVGRPVPFPLYGAGFKNNVYYVSVNSIEPAKLHYFPRSRYIWGGDFSDMHKSFEEKDNYRGKADYFTWSANLAARDTGYLFVYSLHQTKDIAFPLEDSWAVAHPEKFKLSFSNQAIHIYKILK